MNTTQALTMAGVAVDAIGVIDKLVHSAKAADEIVDGLRAFIVSLRDGLSGTTSPQVVLEHLETLRETLENRDAKAASDLDKRFDP